MLSDALTKTAQAGMMTAYTGALVTPKIILWTNDIVPGPDTKYTDLTQPTASWYAPVNAVFGTTFENPDGSVSAQCVSHQFDYSGSDPSVTIRGYAVADVAGTLLYQARQLPGGPVDMGNSLDAVIVAPILTLPPILQAA
jgi:hypothetical protein